MSISGETWTIAGVVVGVATIFATLIAPRLTKVPRIKADVTSWSRLGDGINMPGIEVAVLMNDSKIASPVYLFSGTIENAGQSDITYGDFVDPIRISMGEEWNILSIQIDGPHESGSLGTLRDGVAEINWRILKHGKRISIAMVSEHLGSTPIRSNILDYFQFLLPIRDVKLGDGRISRIVRSPERILMAAILASLAAIMLPLSNLSLDRTVYTDDSGHEYALITAPRKNLPFSRCPPSKMITGCEGMDKKAFSDAIMQSRTVQQRDDFPFPYFPQILFALALITIVWSIIFPRKSKASVAMS